MKLLVPCDYLVKIIMDFYIDHTTKSIKKRDYKSRIYTRKPYKIIYIRFSKIRCFSLTFICLFFYVMSKVLRYRYDIDVISGHVLKILIITVNDFILGMINSQT